MVHRYKIDSILHSGVKDERGTPVTEEKYEHMVGSIVKFDPDTIKDNERFTFWFDYHPFYRWWTMSEIKSHEFKEDGKLLMIETIYSIYNFMDCGEYSIQRSKPIDIEAVCV